ncbi:MAG: CTP-dependent riboflavin kinase [Deltaproteobacteria bacterium]|nr:CTP-dependent riboflavin kinase [Deltaproteobacteria bacterium]
MGRRITGVVFSDLAQASTFMALEWVQKALSEGLGFAPYPATLNLRLESEEDIAAWREVKRAAPSIPITPADPSFCQARCFLVQIEGKLKGAVLFPEVEGYPADKIEVVAPVRLKDELGVRDGEKITLEFMD